MINVYPFIVQKFNKEKLIWEHLESFRSLYSAQCSILTLRSKDNNKYRILEVVDLYV